VTVGQRQLQVPIRSQRSTTLTLQIPEDPGTYVRYVHEHRYLAVLPGSWLDALHRVHPPVAPGTVNAVIAAVVAGIAFYTVGTGRVRLRSRQREASAGGRLRDVFRRE